MICLAAAALAACGGASGEEATRPAPAEGTATAVTTSPPGPGCDAAARCFPALAQATLDRCPAAGLDARGRDARRRLERLLARITAIDLHNEQAYEASDAAAAALTRLEEACLGAAQSSSRQ